jgi:hypothetical protein
VSAPPVGVHLDLGGGGRLVLGGTGLFLLLLVGLLPAFLGTLLGGGLGEPLTEGGGTGGASVGGLGASLLLGDQCLDVVSQRLGLVELRVARGFEFGERVERGTGLGPVLLQTLVVELGEVAQDVKHGRLLHMVIYRTRYAQTPGTKATD